MMLYLLLFIVVLNKEVQQIWGLLFYFISVLKLALAENQPSTQARFFSHLGFYFSFSSAFISLLSQQLRWS